MLSESGTDCAGVNRLSDPRHTFQEIRQTIRRDGVQPALQLLNALSGHRFTGLFLFDGELLKNTFLVDRQMASPHLIAPLPVTASYCLLVRDSGQSLKVTNALTDERLVNHPARERIQSYCAAPLRDRDGQIFGVVCNYSNEPCDADDALIPMLDEFASILLEGERLGEIGWRRRG